MCQLGYFWNTSSLDLAWHFPKLLVYQCWYHLSIWNTSSLDLAWHSPKVLEYQCWYQLSRLKQAPIQQLVPHFPHATRKGISALVSCSFILVSYVQPRHYAISKFLAIFFFPIAIFNQMVSENSLFFFLQAIYFSASPRNRSLMCPGWQLTKCFFFFH